MEIFENNCCNEKGQILNYLMIILRYKMYEYIKDYFNNKKTKVLDNLEKLEYYDKILCLSIKQEKLKEIITKIDNNNIKEELKNIFDL